MIRGYRRRGQNVLRLLANIVYTTTFTNRDPKGQTVADMFPTLFDDDIQHQPISEEERKEMQDLIAEVNKQQREGKQ